jgi:acyl carrier protein
MKNNVDRDEILSDIVKVVQNVTRSSAVDIGSSQENLIQWDSLAYMAIISEVEIRYHIEITQDNISNFTSVESICNLILEQR